MGHYRASNLRARGSKHRRIGIGGVFISRAWVEEDGVCSVDITTTMPGLFFIVSRSASQSKLLINPCLALRTV